MTSVHMVSVMSRYIDAEWALQRMPSEEMISKMVVANAPSIDIVFCKECKYYTKRKFTDGSGEIWAEDICDHYNLTAPNDDDYCSYGERKESE